MTTTADTRKVTLQCQFCLTWNRVDAARAADRPKCGKCAKPMLLDRPVVLTKDSFQRTIEGAEVPILVDFYADWCGPCKMMAPAVDELAREWTGRAVVAKLDTDRAPEISASLRIRGIPTTIVFVGGREEERQTGAVPKGALDQMLRTATSTTKGEGAKG